MTIGIYKKNIKTDVAAGDVDVNVLKDTDNSYNFTPLKIMVVDTVDSVNAVVGCLQQEVDAEAETYQLKSNVEYDLAFKKIFKTGTTTKDILLIGERK